MTPLKTLKKALGIGFALTLCSASAQAAVTWTTWDFNGSISSNQMTVGAAGNNVTATAWDTNYSGANAEYAQTNLRLFSGGIGAGPESTPEHAVDNRGVHEFLLLEFQMPTTLKQLQIGWPSSSSYDTDMTVMAFTGSGAFPTFTRSDMLLRNSDTTDTSGSTRGLTNAGWTLISNPEDIRPSDGLTSIGNDGDVASSYWLIGAYNHFISGDSLIRDGYDYFKLKAVSGYKGDNRVPLPATAALLGLGLVLLGSRKKLKAK
ncbi:MAG: exosortase-dependent surface protein XDP1 [Pseudomonadales bacterium]|jgi:hypothetical protein